VASLRGKTAAQKVLPPTLVRSVTNQLTGFGSAIKKIVGPMPIRASTAALRQHKIGPGATSFWYILLPFQLITLFSRIKLHSSFVSQGYGSGICMML